MRDQFTMTPALSYTATDELPPLVLPPGFESAIPAISGNAVKVYLYLLSSYHSMLAEEGPAADGSGPPACIWTLDSVIEGCVTFDPYFSPSTARDAIQELTRAGLLATVPERGRPRLYLTIGTAPSAPDEIPSRRAPKRRLWGSREWWVIQRIYGFRCAYCGTQDYPLVKEHVVALANGGPDTLQNIVPACPPCNQKKGLQAWTPRAPGAVPDAG